MTEMLFALKLGMAVVGLYSHPDLQITVKMIDGGDDDDDDDNDNDDDGEEEEKEENTMMDSVGLT